MNILKKLIQVILFITMPVWFPCMMFYAMCLLFIDDMAKPAWQWCGEIIRDWEIYRTERKHETK